MLSLNEFLDQYRYNEANHPRAIKGFLRTKYLEVFSTEKTIPDDLSDMDFKTVISYKLYFNDMKKKGENLTPKALKNYKASQVLRKNRKRGMAMFDNESKKLIEIWNKHLLTKEAKMAEKKKTKKAIKKTVKKGTKEKSKKVGIGAFASALILKGENNETVLTKVKKEFPKANTTIACISWYKNKLGKNVKPTPKKVDKKVAKAAKYAKIKKAKKAKKK